jgi:hypothetical protein
LHFSSWASLDSQTESPQIPQTKEEAGSASTRVRDLFHPLGALVAVFGFTDPSSDARSFEIVLQSGVFQKRWQRSLTPISVSGRTALFDPAYRFDKTYMTATTLRSLSNNLYGAQTLQGGLPSLTQSTVCALKDIIVRRNPLKTIVLGVDVLLACAHVLLATMLLILEA